MSEITACPICGAELAGVKEVVIECITLDKEGHVESYNEVPLPPKLEARVYCTGGDMHTHAEMMSHLRGDNTGRGVEIPTWTEN